MLLISAVKQLQASPAPSLITADCIVGGKMKISFLSILSFQKAQIIWVTECHVFARGRIMLHIVFNIRMFISVEHEFCCDFVECLVGKLVWQIMWPRLCWSMTGDNHVSVNWWVEGSELEWSVRRETLTHTSAHAYRHTCVYTFMRTVPGNVLIGACKPI